MFNFIGAGCFDMVSSTALVYPYPKRCILRTLISTSSLLLLSSLCVSERGKKSFIIFKVELLNGFFLYLLFCIFFPIFAFDCVDRVANNEFSKRRHRFITFIFHVLLCVKRIYVPMKTHSAT